MSTSRAPAWLLVDYGEVISTAHDATALAQLADLAGQDVAELDRRYWAARPEYDLGQAAKTYWSRVLGRDPGALVQRLTDLDVDGWLHLNRQTLEALRSHADLTGARLALLSNAPHALADAIDRSEWTRDFERLFFSCRLGHMKPDPTTFTLVLDDLGAAPSEVVFVDDRVENTRAAAAMGIATITFTSAGALSRALGG